MQKRKKEELKYLKRKTYAALEALASAGPGRDDNDRLDALRDALSRVDVARGADLFSAFEVKEGC